MPRERNDISLILAKDILLQCEEGTYLKDGWLNWSIYWVSNIGYSATEKAFEFLEYYLETKILKAIKIRFYMPDVMEEEKLYREETWTIDSKKNFYAITEQAFKDDKTEKLKIYFSLEVDQKLLKQFIQGYIIDWQRNNFYLKEGNLYKSSKQLLEVVQHLLKLLEESSPNHLLLEDLRNSKIDFLATLLFLEERGYLKINWLEALENPSESRRHDLAVRVDLHEQFLEMFSMDVKDLEYYEYLIDKEAFSERIVFAYPRLLICKSKTHELQREQVPYHLLQLAYKGKGEVDEKELEEEIGEKDLKLKKALNNFRRILRKKFEFSEDEAFFTKQGDKLVFDMELFCFLPEKAKISL